MTASKDDFSIAVSISIRYRKHFSVKFPKIQGETKRQYKRRLNRIAYTQWAEKALLTLDDFEFECIKLYDRAHAHPEAHSWIANQLRNLRQVLQEKFPTCAI